MKPIVNGISAATNFYTDLAQCIERNNDVVLATVAATHGSAPQKTGNSAVFDKNGLVTGTIGGGIVEFSMQKNAQDAVQTKKSTLHIFSLTNEVSDKEGAICGGSMEILLDASPHEHISVFKAVEESLNKREPGVMVVLANTKSSGRLLIEREWITREILKSTSVNLTAEVENQIKDMLAAPKEGDFRRVDVPATLEQNRQSFFLNTVVPSPRLIIAGAGHVGKALSHLAKLLGFEVLVWDYRSDYATKENIPDADIILSGDIGKSLADVAIDRNTYAIAVTTGHKHDMEVLKLFMGSAAGYIGMIGSRKKTKLVREKFLAEGWATQEQWDRIYAPIGLDIHSQTVEEIAVSIAAQLIQVRHQLNKRR